MTTTINLGNTGRDMSGNVAGRDIHIHGPKAKVIPLQRPPKLDIFQNRTAELSKLLAQLKPGETVTLCGPGGMGKTALATQAIWHLAPENEPPAQFPDGLIMHSFYDQPKLDDLFLRIIFAFGEKPEPPFDQLVQQLLSGKTLLLLLDGAEDAEDLPTLLKLTNRCGVLITSRQPKDAPSPRLRQDLAPCRSLRIWPYCKRSVATNCRATYRRSIHASRVCPWPRDWPAVI